MAAYLRMRDAGVRFEKGISIGHTRIAQLVKKEIRLPTYMVIEAEDRLRLNRNSGRVGK